MEELETLIVQTNDTNDKLDELITVNESSLVQQKEIAESISELNPTMEAILVKLAEEKDQEKDKEKVTVSKMDSLPEELNSVVGGFSTVFIKGEKGDKGDTPEKGKDYFKQEEIESFLKEITPKKGTDYFDGEKGEKGDTGERGEKGEKGDQGIQGEKGNDGKDGDDGKDGSPDTPKQIIEKLRKLKKGTRLSFEKDLDDVPNIQDEIKKAVSRATGLGIKYLKDLGDIDIIGQINDNTTDGWVLTWDFKKTKFVLSPRGSGNFAYTHTQTTPATTWVVNHNFNDTAPIVNVYNESGVAIEPESITVTNANTITITFGNVMTGKATVVANGGMIPIETVDWSNIQNKPEFRDLALQDTVTIAQVDGLQDELDLKANNNAVVKLTGDQTVAGVKTFSSIPVLPSSDPTTANQATRKDYVDNQVATKEPLKVKTRIASTDTLTPDASTAQKFSIYALDETALSLGLPTNLADQDSIQINIVAADNTTFTPNVGYTFAEGNDAPTTLEAGYRYQFIIDRQEDDYFITWVRFNI